MRERALRAGFNLYLPKPLDPLMLAREIARHVGLVRSRRLLQQFDGFTQQHRQARIAVAADGLLLAPPPLRLAGRSMRYAPALDGTAADLTGGRIMGV